MEIKEDRWEPTARQVKGSEGRMMKDGPVISETSSGNVHPMRSASIP